MPFINLPPVISELFWDLDRRIRSLETSYRFNMPNIDFTTNEPTNPRTGDLFYNTATDEVTYWDGTQWVVLVNNANGTIGAETTVTATLKTVNNNIVYTGNPVYVTSQQLGNSITAYADIQGDTVTDWGTGQIYFQLPAGFPAFAHDVVAPGYLNRNGTTYTVFGLLAQGDNKMYLWCPTSNGGSEIVDYNTPAVLNSNSYIILNGVAILA